MPTKTTPNEVVASVEADVQPQDVLGSTLRLAADAAAASRAFLVRNRTPAQLSDAVPAGVDDLWLMLPGAQPRELGLLDRAASLVRQAWVWQVVTGSGSSRAGRARRRNFLGWFGDKLRAAEQMATPLALLLLEIEDRDPLTRLYGTSEVSDRVSLAYNAVERAVRGVDSVYRCDDATLAVVLPRCDLANAAKVARRIQDGIEVALQAPLATNLLGLDLRIYAFPDDLGALVACTAVDEVAKEDPTAMARLWTGLAAGAFRASAQLLVANERGSLSEWLSLGTQLPSQVPRAAEDVFLAASPAVVPRTGAGERASLYLPVPGPKGPVGVLLLESIHGGFGPAEVEIGKRIGLRLGLHLSRIQPAPAAVEAAPAAPLPQREYRYHYDGIIGKSAPMCEVFDLLERIIETDYPVIVQGESGTGKELVARAIHFNGRRKDKPLIAENCAALNENLLEAELFGYEKGSFTGAETSRKGLFELADGGTLFLDEVADMTNGMQKDLLRILQEGIVRPVGSKKFFHVDVRIICASNRDLMQLVNEGKFRADLFYRLNVWCLHMPPLRDRREDIPLLVEHFLGKIAQQTGMPNKRLGKGVLDSLMAYDWPGNIRELKNELTRMVALASGDEIVTRDLSRRTTGERVPVMERNDDILPLEEMEKLHILKALRFTNGNRAKAATLLGINKATIYRKLKSYGLD